MEVQIGDVLNEIRRDVRDGFTSVNARIDDLVTRGEFVATIARVDAEHATLRRDFDGHEVKTEAIMERIRQEDAEVLRQALDAITKVEGNVDRSLSEFRTTTRWAVGLGATAIIGGVGSLVAFFQFILPHLS